MTLTQADLPDVRGKLSFEAPLAPYTWFRVGGPADTLFLPADEDDLASFLSQLDPSIPVTVLGIGSNVIVRDGGIEGVVIRLAGRGFGGVEVKGTQITAGAAVPDAMVARKAAEAGIAGLEFFSGVPGAIGGALRMNAGCYGSETKDVVTEIRAVTRAGEHVTLTNAQMGYSYRHSEAPTDMIFTSAVFEGEAGDPDEISAAIEALQARRGETQPIREKTGGSTFANPDPPGTPDQRSSWKLIDAAGCRGLRVGGAQVSELHCNFLINTGEATASDLEALGELVRARVRESSDVDLRWEIRRIGRIMA